jgi:hypothetical protein
LQLYPIAVIRLRSAAAKTLPIPAHFVQTLAGTERSTLQDFRGPANTLSVFRLARAGRARDKPRCPRSGPLSAQLANQDPVPHAGFCSDELAGERSTDDADQAPAVYAVWGGGSTPTQALYMVGLILPPR